MTLALAVLLSGVVALSLSPMLCSRILSVRDTTAHHGGRLYQRILGGYERILRACLHHKLLVMLVAGGTLAGAGAVLVYMPKGFMPEANQGYLRGFTETQQGISYAAMREHEMRLAPIIEKIPGITGQQHIIGIPLQNQGRLNVTLDTEGGLSVPLETLRTQLLAKLNQVPGIKVFLNTPPMINIGARNARALYQFTLLSPSTDALYAAAPEFEKALAKLPELTSVSSDLLLSNPQVDLDIDRDKAALLGVSLRSIEDALYTAYGERTVTNIRTSEDEYPVIMELLPEFQTDPRALSMLYVRSNSGELVRLDALAAVRQSLGPAQVNHTGQLPSVTYSFNTAPGVSLDVATQVVQDLAGRTLPDNITTRFEGTAKAFQESMASMGPLLLLAVAVIYIILGCLYESFLHPITILSGIPSAALGGVLALAAFDMTLDLFGFLGIILLIGIVKKNSIMVVDFAITQEAHGMDPEEAAIQGSLIRFRPIMMTTLAAIAGSLPIAIGYGAGGEARQPLGVVVVGGLILSQMVTLFLTPVFYAYMARLQHWFGRRGQRSAA
ncbi:MAG: efflux RND transporter permease subunit, partial [Desulfovibrionaceae bacterium]